MGNQSSATVLEQSAEKEISTVKVKNKGKGFLKGLFAVVVYALAFLFVAHSIWVFSGSNQWKYIGEDNGVKVYTLKAPGADLVQAKGVFRVHATLGSIVKFMQDPDTCNDVGCYDARTVERVDEHLRYDYFKIKFPPPFSPRDFMVRQQLYQSPTTKEILMEFAAAPDKTPLNNCCVRVTTMANTWRFTPLGNGEVEIEYIINMNEGGYMPDLLLNLVHPKIMAQLPNLQKFFDKPKFKNATLDFIQEK